jgi:hypothetical protein
MPRRNLPAWPRFLATDDAAAYLGVTAQEFLAEVGHNAWPAPQMRAGRPMWDRAALDLRADAMSALGGGAGMPPAKKMAEDMWMKAIGHARR